MHLSKRHQVVVGLPYITLHFLIKEKLLSKFVTNCVASCKPLTWLNTNGWTTHELFAQSFNSHNTPEGGKFWFIVSRKYRVYLNGLIINSIENEFKR